MLSGPSVSVFVWQLLPRPPLDPVCPVVPPFVNIRHELFIYFAWIIVQFLKIFFPPFSHIYWFGENTAVFYSRGMRLRDSSYSLIHCSWLIVGSAIFHLVAYSPYEFLFILLDTLFDNST